MSSTSPFNQISKPNQNNPKIFIYGENMSGKTTRALSYSIPEKTIYITLDGKADQVSDKAQTLNILSLNEHNTLVKKGVRKPNDFYGLKQLFNTIAYILESVPEDYTIILDGYNFLEQLIKNHVKPFSMRGESNIDKKKFKLDFDDWAVVENHTLELLELLKEIKQTLIIIDQFAYTVVTTNDNKNVKEHGPEAFISRPNKPKFFNKLMNMMDYRILTKSRKLGVKTFYSCEIESQRSNITLPNKFLEKVEINL